MRRGVAGPVVVTVPSTGCSGAAVERPPRAPGDDHAMADRAVGVGVAVDDVLGRVRRPGRRRGRGRPVAVHPLEPARPDLQPHPLPEQREVAGQRPGVGEEDRVEVDQRLVRRLAVGRRCGSGIRRNAASTIASVTWGTAASGGGPLPEHTNGPGVAGGGAHLPQAVDLLTRRTRVLRTARLVSARVRSPCCCAGFATRSEVRWRQPVGSNGCRRPIVEPCFEPCPSVIDAVARRDAYSAAEAGGPEMSPSIEQQSENWLH